MSPPYLGRILRRERPCSAEYVIRISRALRLEFLQALYLAGYIKKEEASLAKKFIPDDPHMYRIWSGLKDLNAEQMKLCEKPILAIIEACAEAKGGDTHAKPLDTKTGHG